MSERGGCQDILGRFLEVVDFLEAAIEGLGGTELDLALDPDSWSIKQIVHHVVDGDDLWKIYIKAVLGKPRRVLSIQWYWDVPQDSWAETWAYADRALPPSLDLFRASRAHIVQLLRHVPGACERRATFRWPSGEETVLSVGDLVAMQTDHVIHHVADIRAIREVHGA